MCEVVPKINFDRKITSNEHIRMRWWTHAKTACGWTYPQQMATLIADNVPIEHEENY